MLGADGFRAAGASFGNGVLMMVEEGAVVDGGSGVTLTAPPKRPQSAFQLFSKWIRNESDLVKGLKVTDAQKVIGEQWKSLEREKRQEFESEAAELKSQYETQKKKFSEQSLVSSQDRDSPSNPFAIASKAASSKESKSDRIPEIKELKISVIKRIMKCDDDVKSVTKEAASLVALATELFIEKLGKNVMALTKSYKLKTIREEHLYEFVQKNSNFEFLRQTFPKSGEIDKHKKRPRSIEDQEHEHVQKAVKLSETAEKDPIPDEEPES